MNTERNTISHVVERWFGAYMRRRRRKMGERIMNELPPSLQRDIGWQPTGPARRR
ncbi:hypothetical protein [Chelativorans intermedius]|uniref:DUF1127 domain-containing protein n=1 Tax=Chelativorans intermedius TaxID=515947 RepID=A0ABV6D7H7_9HYPH|nr:hypothetical protein [Chelativorans intermedius]MCT8999257.1 hypothetical protein [Chelativorans intermedius]